MLSGATGAGIQCALQHPYSRGTILINSTEPFDYPVIDPKYFGLGYDIDIMAAGFAFVRKVGGSAPLSTCEFGSDFLFTFADWLAKPFAVLFSPYRRERSRYHLHW